MRTIIRLSISFTLLALAACASTSPQPPSSTFQSPPSEELRASFGTVGVVSLGAAPNTNPKFDRLHSQISPGVGSGALQGAGDWTRFVFSDGEPRGPFGEAELIIYFVGLPVAAVVGGIEAEGEKGGARLSNKDKSEIEATFRKAVAEHRAEDELRERVVAQASTAMVQKIIDMGTGGVINPAKKTDYAPFAEKGVETILEVGVIDIAVSVGDDRSGDRYLTVSVAGRARLIRVADGRVLWSDEERALHREGHSLPQWNLNDDVRLTSEVVGALDNLAQEFVFKAFLESPSVEAN